MNWKLRGCVMLLIVAGSQRGDASDAAPFGLEKRPQSRPYLLMPESESGRMPARLSETGAFINTPSLVPSSDLIPYDLNVPFWSDGASKRRWISVPHQPGRPPGEIGFSPTAEWKFPPGTVFVKHFESAIGKSVRRLETRLLVCNPTGAVYGVTYKWRPDQSDADLLRTNAMETIGSEGRTQNWYFPGSADCRLCHNAASQGVLGVKTRELNGPYKYPNGITDNQLREWNHIGLFDSSLDQAEIASYPKLSRADNVLESLSDRARSYLDANCAHCHRPGGAVTAFDLRYDTPLEKQMVINGAVLIDEGIDGARIVAPNDPWRSILLFRVNTLEAFKMPPLAHERVDSNGVALIEAWIRSLPGPRVLEPPLITPQGGEFKHAVRVAISHRDPGASIRYTLDGTAPGKSAAQYQQPLELNHPATLRARAYREGFTRSIPAQETFIVLKDGHEDRKYLRK